MKCRDFPAFLFKKNALTGEPNIKLLIEQVKVSNEAAEYSLFKLFFPYIKSICIRYSNSEEETQEMLNDTFLKIFKNIDKYDPDYDFKPWIRKVCINSCLTYNRKYFNENIHVSIDNLHDIQTDESLDFVTNSFTPDECLSFLTKLSTQYRTVFNLYVFEEMKHHEIAQELNISVGTSKSNLNRAKAQLLEIMKSEKTGILNNKKSLNG